MSEKSLEERVKELEKLVDKLLEKISSLEERMNRNHMR